MASFVFVKPQDVIAQLFIGVENVTMLDQDTGEHIEFIDLHTTINTRQTAKLAIRVYHTVKMVDQYNAKQSMTWTQVKEVIEACWVLSEFH